MVLTIFDLAEVLFLEREPLSELMVNGQILIVCRP